MTHLFHRAPLSPPLLATGGEGCFLIGADGKRYLDGSGGAAVSCLGHSDDRVKAAVHAQIDALPFAHTGFFTSAPAEALAEKLIAQAPEGFGRVYLTSGGSESVEAALKLARQWAIDSGQPDRRRIIARDQSYHGNTLGALATGGNAARRAPFAPLLPETWHIPPCYAYRGQATEESEAEYGRRAADTLEAQILALGPETVLAFVAETVVGATLGSVPAAQGYFRRIREICDQYGILLILDEVMCGSGRCGTFFAFEAEGITPNIVTIAKGLGAGYQPIGAVLCTEALYQTIVNASGAFQHGHTYIGHPVAAAAANAVMGRLIDDDVLGRVTPAGEALLAALTDRLGQHPHIGDIRGRGLFRSVELVADRDTKTPFDPARKLHAKVKTAAMEEGLVCYPMGGTADGKAGDHVLLAPPYIISEDEIGMLADRLGAAIDRALDA